MTATKGTTLNPRKRTGAKLTPDQVREIKGRLGSETSKELAYQFSVSRSTIGHIKSGRTWPEIEPTEGVK